jgi:outer membrane lipoprotein
MEFKMRPMIAAISALLLLSGCSHIISDASLRLVDRSVTYRMLKEEPDRYQGRYLLLGGAVASVRNAKGESVLEVVQYNLDSDGMPLEPNLEGGRFLARTDRFIDPLIFKNDRLVTLVGSVSGHRKQTLGDMEYDYPIINIREMHIWRRPSPVYYYPYPYPYYYPYDWWWWRPYRPWPHRG